MRKPKSKKYRIQKKLSDQLQEIELLKSWIESHQPVPISNLTSFPDFPLHLHVGHISNTTLFSRYAYTTRFEQLPISNNTTDTLRQSKYDIITYIQRADIMIYIQRAALPHTLCDRDVRSASRLDPGKL